MATPNVSSAGQFVKNYPITLCGFFLLFMPSVYRLLFYFTPLLISTAIFIVAMMSWGPAKPSQSGMRSGKRNNWAFSASLKIYDDDEEEEGEGDDEEVQAEAAAEASFPKRKIREGHDTAEKEDSSLEGKPIHVKLDTANKQEPITDSVADKNERAAMASKGSVSQAEPDPDLDEDRVIGAGSYSFCSSDLPDELMNGAADGHLQHIPAAAKLAAANPDQPAAHNLTCHDAEQDHTGFHDAETSCLDDDGVAEPEAEQVEQLDLPREPSVQAKSKARHVENEMAVPAEQSELRQLAGKLNRASYKGDRHDSFAHQLAKRLQTLQAAA